MNNFIKLFMGAMFVFCVNVAVAEETAGDTAADTADTAVATTETDSTDSAPAVVTARMDCDAIKARIAELNALEEPEADDTAELARLQAQHRKDCVKKATSARIGMRSANANKTKLKSDTVAAVVTADVAAPVAPVTTSASDVPATISAEQTQMCNRLPDAVERAGDEQKKTLQDAYDEYCTKKVVASESVIKMTMMVVDTVAPLETEEQKAARIDANLDAGLCADGSKPNKYGCCNDEVFKDIGDLNFACCPKDGGTCFPPIK